MPKVVTHRIVVPAREARLARIRAGQQFSVVDLDGGQVGDLFVFAAGDATEFHSASHTRSCRSRLFPAVGEEFVSNRRRPMLRFIDDTSPGVHDMLIAACDPARYEALGTRGHASCAENLRAALSAAGLESTCVPQPINLFMNIPARPDHTLEWLPAISTPGQGVTFEALMDCNVVLSACPQDLNAINGTDGPTDLAIDVVAATTKTEETT